MRRLAVLTVAVATLILAPAADAAIPEVFDGNGDIACVTQGPGPYQGQRWCGTGKHNQNADLRSTVKSFDGVPIDVNVAFPPATGSDGPYPLVMMFHGYGGGKVDFPSMQRWLSKGYAVFAQTNRGFHESCGTETSKAADPVCVTKGFVRLDDTRYEVRDAQLFAGMLADDGLVEPQKIAASGGSYGGGMSMALAALKDRTMMPDGTLVPWKSPKGTSMSLAVAIPNVPWTDLAYSLVPNGSNLDYIRNASYYGRFGVMKQSYVNGLYLSGALAPGYYTLPGAEPAADLTGWKQFMDLGEPYDSKPESGQMLDEITTHHSSYYIDHSVAPAPLLISSGFTDDLFPVNEATRFYNRTRAQYPDSPLGLFFGSFGHPRGQNKSDVVDALVAKEDKWVGYYLSGTGSKPASNVTTYLQTCPDEAPSGEATVTKDWASQSPGEIRLKGKAAQTIAPDGGDRAVSAAFNPAPSGKACTAVAGAEEPGTANYELDPAPAGGYTVMGAPTVIAKISLPGDNSQLAARLVDVSPDGSSKTLVNRALWRPENSGYQVFQLQANGWKVDPGHSLRLELLPSDSSEGAKSPLGNYGRPSNDQQPATISRLELRVPVAEKPGALKDLVKKPAKKVLPDRPGVKLAPGYNGIGSVTLKQYRNGSGNLKLKGKAKAKGRKLTARVTCAGKYSGCPKAKIKFKGVSRGAKGLIAKRKVKLAPGKTKRVKFNLTGRGRKALRKHRKVKAKVLVNGKRSGKITIKRVGRVR